MRVFVLLFNAGTDNEGIHTLKIGDRDIVLMFEQEDDATRYALMLEAQDFGSPAVESFESEEIEGFCQDAGYTCRLIPDGALEVPPENNVDSLDWDPKAKASSSRDRHESSESSEPSEFSASELDRIRRTLEGLL